MVNLIRGGSLLLVPTTAVVLFACGSRTALDLPLSHSARAIDDAAQPPDASNDAPDDALDASLAPPLDASPPPPPPPALCNDASAPVIYAVTLSGNMLRFDPTTLSFTVMPTPQCATDDYPQPFSMAVDHTGVAYVQYQSATGVGERLYRVSLVTGACTMVELDAGDTVFANFGMGFSVDDGGETETLYLSGVDDAGDTVLGAVNETTLAFKTIGTVKPAIEYAELAGTGDGRLYTLYTPDSTGGTTQIAELNRETAVATSIGDVDTVLEGGWAFAFWGGEFYVFSGTATEVTRFNPADGTSIAVASYEDTIVGAGASTCAPIR